jgi:isopenicillin N synthase-like dioxygenase
VFDECWKSAKEFFDLAPADKMQVPMTDSYPYGYEQKEILSQSIEDESGKKVIAADWKETFQFCLNNSDGKFVLRWPSKPKGFEQAASEYYRAMENLGAELMKIFALALELPIDWFDNKINNHQSALRILNYPHQDHVPEAGQVRASAHTDYGTLTILAADDAPGGLEVQNHDGTWQSVKVSQSGAKHDGLNPRVFVVNLGDLMQRWTNDRWRSTMHRVVNPPREIAESGINTRRQSIAFFMNPNPDLLVEPILLQNQAPKYPPVLAQDHLLSKHYAAAKGKN